MRKAWISALAFAALASALTAEEKPQAKGTFESKVWKLEIVGAYAFPAAEVGFDDEPGVKVVISNRGFEPTWIDRFNDREHWIDERFRDEEDFVVYLQFDLKGNYAGLSYYFESGDGCGYCYDSGVTSTVKIEKGRVAGRVARAPKEDEYHFDVEFDVPLASNDHGEPLPADGGEVGQVYAAYHQALKEWKADAVAGFLTADNSERFLKDKEKALGAWYSDHPTERYKIVKGFIRGDQALLLVEGATSVMDITVEVIFDKEKGAWKIADELLAVKLGE